MEYKIKESNENPFDTVIERTGAVDEFTLRESEVNAKDLEKLKKQFEAHRELNAAKMKNIEDHHPFVLQMSEEDCFTAHMYQEARASVRVMGPKIDEVVKSLADYELEKVQIMAALPELAAAMSPKPAETVSVETPASEEPSGAESK